MNTSSNHSNPRVLILSTNSDEAGAPVHVYSVVSSLVDRVNFVVIFGEEGPIANKIRKLGVPVEIVPEMRSAMSFMLDLRAFSKISKYIKSSKPDLIHAHSSKAGMIGRMACIRHKIPCIYTVHGWGWRGFGSLKASVIFLIEKLLSFIPRSSMIFVSKSVEWEGKNKLLLHQKKGLVIYNGVPDLFRKKKEFIAGTPLSILMPARVSAAKDHLTLIKAFEEFELPSRLYLCGTGTDSVEFINQAIKVAPKRYADIFFLGPRSDIPELLEEADIFTLISNFEALPISIIEAMSAARSIIASDVGGVNELIDDGISGLLVKKNDYKQVLIALNKLSDNSFREKCAEEARRKYLIDFTDKIMANKLFARYSAAILESR